MAVSISDEDFEFMYRTFQRLHEIGLNEEDIVESMQAEDAIWNLLQKLRSENLGPVAATQGNTAVPYAPHPSDVPSPPG